MRKTLLLFVSIFLLSPTLYSATCTVSGTVTASGTTCSSIGSGDTMLITGTLNLNSNYTVHASNNIVVIVDGGSIVWNGNYGFDLGSGASLLLVNGGALVNGSGSCNANKVISFGGTDLASCNGGGASYSFADVASAGGINSSGPVPVNLINFSGTLINGQDVKLIWSTATELNNKEFIISRSFDGIIFEELDRINGQGTSNHISDYQFLDREITSNVIYYKLTQVDFDGRSESFNIVKIKKDTSSLKFYPNPFENFIEVSRTDAPTTEIKVLDILGNTVYSDIIGDHQSFRINTNQFPAGIYFIQVGDVFERLIKN